MNKKGLLGAIAILILILIVVGFFYFIRGSNLEENCPGEGCVKVQTTCCPCSSGGEEKCVKESEVEKYEEKLKECSKDLVCPAIYSCIIDSCERK